VSAHHFAPCSAPSYNLGDVTASLLPATLRTLANLRDVGGLRTDDGRVVRSGVLLRSDAP
jgi:hypothetical protein